jgi:hypothetical protein
MKTVTSDDMVSGKRPTWAGSVAMTIDSIQHIHYGEVCRIVEVAGIVVPTSTGDRGPAPEPICIMRVSTAKAEPKKYKYNSKTGVNAYNTGMIDGEKGHVMALELGGPDIPQNIVPQWAKWQGSGVWRQSETAIRDLAVKGDPADSTTPGYRLMFHCVVSYYSPSNDLKWLAMINMNRLCVPSGFSVYITKLEKANNTPTETPQLFFNSEHRRDKTDEMIAMRNFERVEGDDMEYPDWVKKGTNEKSKGHFVDTGQDLLHVPPPTSYKPGKFEMTSYMQEKGVKVRLNKNMELDEDEPSDEDYDPSSESESSNEMETH